MAFVPVDFFSARLTAQVSAVVTALPITPSAATFLAGVLATPGDYTYLVLRDGTTAETVKVTSVVGNLLNVQRGVGQFPAAIFPSGAQVSFAWVLQAIEDWTAQNVAVTPINLTGDGAVEVTGSYPDFTISGTFGGTTNNNEYITNPPPEGSGIASVDVDEDGLATVHVEVPTFTGLGGVTVTGDWPNFEISVSDITSGIVETISDAGGGHIVVGGTSANVTLDLADTGFPAGTYGGLVLDAKGRVTDVNILFNPIFNVTSANTAISVTIDGDRSVEIEANPASTTDAGVVQLATAAEIITGTSEDLAVTPKAVADVLVDVRVTNDSTFSHTAEASANYTNVIGSLLDCEVPNGQVALVTAQVALVDSGGSTLPFVGIALFDQGTAALLQGIQSVYSFVHNLTFSIAGPASYSLELRSTALGGTVSVVSSSISYVLAKPPV